MRPWLPRTLLALAVWLIAAEGVLRIPAVQAALPAPEPTLWHAPLVDRKVRNLERVESEHGIDVLFVGNSSVQSGIDPTLFDQERCGSGAAGCTSYNGSIEGLPPYGVRLFLEIYLRYSNPHTVVYGLLPQDLNSASPWAKDVTDRVEHSVMVQAEARRSWKGRLLAAALESSHLFRYRFVLHRLLLLGGFEGPAVERAYFDDRGFHPIPAEAAGHASQSFERHPGLLNFSLEGPQARELAEIVALCKRRGIRLILADMPVSDRYLALLDDPADYERYAARIRAIAAAGEADVWGPQQLAPAGIGAADFSDTSHLNVAGARKLTARLAVLLDNAAATKTDPEAKVVSLDRADLVKQ